MIAGASIQYSSKTADFDLRESISRLQGQIDLLCYGILDENTEEENSQFLHKLKNGADNLYQILNYSIIDKANRLEQVVKELNEMNKIIKKKNMQIKIDINLARRVQQNLIPLKPLIIPELEIASHYKPIEEVGGDFFEFMPSSEKTLGLFISDVSGHGISAAFVTAMLKVACSMFRSVSFYPGEFLMNLNNYIYGKISDNFLTVSYNVFDYKNKLLKYANAGHPNPFIYRKKSGELIELEAAGTVVGAFSGLTYEEKEITLECGDRILFYTDGLIEVVNKNDELYGEERLALCLKENINKPLDDFLKIIMDEVDLYRSGTEIQDDIAIIAVDVKS